MVPGDVDEGPSEFPIELRKFYSKTNSPEEDGATSCYSSSTGSNWVQLEPTRTNWIQQDPTETNRNLTCTGIFFFKLACFFDPPLLPSSTIMFTSCVNVMFSLMCALLFYLLPKPPPRAPVRL